nr:hypothetical protein [uncultured Draconibacterium sp.]
MKNEKINTEVQAINAEKNTANEKWETPEVSVISVDETKLHQNYGSDAVAMS